MILDNIFNDLKNDTIILIPKIITSIIIFIIFITVAYILKNLLYAKKDYTDLEVKQNLINNEIGNFLFYVILFIGIVFAIINLGIQTNTILTLFGTFCFALGFAIQDTIKNFIAGIYLSIIQIYVIGDIIQVEQTIGKVIDFNFFNTTIVNQITKIPNTIPNYKIQTNIISNFTANNIIFLETNIVLSNTSIPNINNLQDIFIIIKKSLSNSKYIINNSLIVINVKNINIIGTELVVNTPIISLNYYNAKNEILNLIRESLSKNKILLL